MKTEAEEPTDRLARERFVKTKSLKSISLPTSLWYYPFQIRNVTAAMAFIKL